MTEVEIYRLMKQLLETLRHAHSMTASQEGIAKLIAGLHAAYVWSGRRDDIAKRNLWEIQLSEAMRDAAKWIDGYEAVSDRNACEFEGFRGPRVNYD